jgi:DNA-binding NarL/FixJ family response regulator
MDPTREDKPNFEELQPGSISVLLVDNEVVVRTGLRCLLQSWPELSVVGEISHLESASPAISQKAPDIVLLNAGMAPGSRILERLPAIVETPNGGRVIVLVSDADADLRLSAVELGAMGVVFKERPPEDLRKAICHVSSGEIWLDRSSMAKVLSQLIKGESPNKPSSEEVMLDSLTERERQIAALVCEGLQNEDIGKALFISETTVRHHLTSIFDKLGVSNRLELVVFFYRNQFVNAS